MLEPVGRRRAKRANTSAKGARRQAASVASAAHIKNDQQTPSLLGVSDDLKFSFDFIMTLAPISYHVVDLLVCEVIHNCGEDSVNYGVPLPIVVF